MKQFLFKFNQLHCTTLCLLHLKASLKYFLGDHETYFFPNDVTSTTIFFVIAKR